MPIHVIYVHLMVLQAKIAIPRDTRGSLIDMSRPDQYDPEITLGARALARLHAG